MGTNPGAVIRLASPGGARATVFPGTGFNLIDWQVPVPGRDEPLSVLHAEPDVLAGGSGTRSGVPILFPFPNRIAGASFHFGGATITLPAAHPGDPNAIHGFCAKAPWHDVEQVGDARVTGTFRLGRDAAATAAWPGDLQLTLTISLRDDAVRYDALVENVDTTPVPFGLGYHPYFTALGATSPAQLQVSVPAASSWVLQDAIPTGQQVPVAGALDLNDATPLGDRVLDDVLTGLPSFDPAADGLMTRATLRGQAAQMLVRCDASFRDLVVFTPANRAAFAVEPYTCPTDAVHLAARGLDVGWRVLTAGERWRGVVEFAVTPLDTPDF